MPLIRPIRLGKIHPDVIPGSILNRPRPVIGQRLIVLQFQVLRVQQPARQKERVQPSRPQILQKNDQPSSQAAHLTNGPPTPGRLRSGSQTNRRPKRA
jgi:hypothetical protein